MLEATVHQQSTSGVPTASKLIQQVLSCAVQPAFHLSLASSPINKFNPVVSNNSMFHSDMGFFVHPAQALANTSKWDQFPASA